MRFMVLGASPDGRRVSLADTRDRRYVARATSSAPAIGSSLHGVSPSPGFALLSEPSTGRTYRVIFEQVDGAPPVLAD